MFLRWSSGFPLLICLRLMMLLNNEIETEQ